MILLNKRPRLGLCNKAVWCEDQNYCKNLIGGTSSFKIRVIQTKNGFTNNLIKYYQKQKSLPKIAPRHEWIKAVLGEEHSKSKNLEMRFSLMVSWGYMCGLRAHEICALNLNQIPLRETIEQSILAKKNIFIELTVTKGMKKARIPVSGILLLKTLDYIEFERNHIIKKISKKNRIQREVYIPPEEVFISSTTGQALHPRTLSNQIRNCWLKAVHNGSLTKDQHVWLHGLRHRFATDKLKEISKFKHIRNPNEVTKTLTRHNHSSTLDNYIASIHLEDMYD